MVSGYRNGDCAYGCQWLACLNQRSAAFGLETTNRCAASLGIKARPEAIFDSWAMEPHTFPVSLPLLALVYDEMLNMSICITISLIL